MIDVPLPRRAGLAAALDPVLVERRRTPRIAPPAGWTAMPTGEVALAPTPASGWRDDLRFFIGCYVAGLAFFLILLS